ncbi:hypothetical protein AVEN_31780-1 [Araneus ventricosus]|uniref:Uncharacterized protein n=1 Tax=Araneus ventricosus TaxID=182803 RepID=A0A4Y2JSM3_ARAVE|nr:hypothetical protein AVEN_31780-1 [Araneus ventricosus]
MKVKNPESFKMKVTLSQKQKRVPIFTPFPLLICSFVWSTTAHTRIQSENELNGKRENDFLDSMSLPDGLILSAEEQASGEKGAEIFFWPRTSLFKDTTKCRIFE